MFSIIPLALQTLKSQQCLCGVRNLSSFIPKLELASFCSSVWRHAGGSVTITVKSIPFKVNACLWLGPFSSHVEGICDSSHFVLHFISSLLGHVDSCLTPFLELNLLKFIPSTATLPLEKHLPSPCSLKGGRRRAYEYRGRRLHPWCFWKLISWFYSLRLDSVSVVQNTTHVSCHKAHFQLLWAGYEEQALWAANVWDKVPDNYSWPQPRVRETNKNTTNSKWTN